MNRDRVENKWKQDVEKTGNHRKNIMNDEPAANVEKDGQFAGILQKKYGAAKEEVNRRVDAFKSIIVQFKNPIGS